MIGNYLLKEQLTTGARFDGSKQHAVTSSLGDILKTQGGAKKNLNVQVVIQTIRAAYLTRSSRSPMELRELCTPKPDQKEKWSILRALPGWAKKQLTLEEISALRQE